MSRNTDRAERDRRLDATARQLDQAADRAATRAMRHPLAWLAAIRSANLDAPALPGSVNPDGTWQPVDHEETPAEARERTANNAWSGYGNQPDTAA
jgi:hypothetical protein